MPTSIKWRETVKKWRETTNLNVYFAMTFVILQAPNDGYYWLVKAAGNKHFELEDSGFIEIDSGDYWDMLAKIEFLESDSSKEMVELLCSDTNSKIQTTVECLERILELNPDYLDNKSFV